VEETISTVDTCRTNTSPGNGTKRILFDGDIAGAFPSERLSVKTVGSEPTIGIYMKGGIATNTTIDVQQKPYRIPKGDTERICPQGFVLSNSSCYGMFDAETLKVTSWKEAQDLCASLAPDGIPLGLTSSREKEDIQHFLRSVWWEFSSRHDWLLIGLESNQLKNKVRIKLS
jgi:hypothetical protein